MKPTTAILHSIFIFGFTGISPAQICTFQDDFTNSASQWTIEDVTTSGPASPARIEISDPGTGNNALRFINSNDGSNITRAYQQLNNPLCDSWIVTGDFMVTMVGSHPIESSAHFVFVASENSSGPTWDINGQPIDNGMIGVQVGGSPDDIRISVQIKVGTVRTVAYSGVGLNQISLDVNYSFVLERIHSDFGRITLIDTDVNDTILEECFEIPDELTNDLQWVQVSNNPQGSWRRVMTAWVDNLCIQDCNNFQICCDGNPLTVDIGPDQSMCDGDTILLEVGGLTADQWAIWSTGDTLAGIEVTTPGTYWVELHKAGCVAYDTVVVTLNPNQTEHYNFNRQLCTDSTLTLSVQGVVPTQFDSLVVWNDGQTGSEIAVNAMGTYIATVALPCSTITVTFDVDQISCAVVVNPVEEVEFFMPNTFTPNGDRLNERFEFYMTGIRSFRFIVFDRWNNRVFESERADHFWDGTNKGTPCPVGVYVWRLEAIGYYGDSYSRTGWIELIR